MGMGMATGSIGGARAARASAMPLHSACNSVCNRSHGLGAPGRRGKLGMRRTAARDGALRVMAAAGKPRVAIAGVTGAVGQEFLQVLKERNFPYEDMKMLASARCVRVTFTH